VAQDPQSALIRAVAEATQRVVWQLTGDATLAGDSPSWCAFTGQSGDEARGAGWLDAIHPEDRERVLARWQGTGPVDVECRVRRPGGRYTRIRARGVALEGGGWVATSEEVWADESVRRSEERLRLATQSANVAVWEYDFVAGQMTRTENHDALYGLAPQGVWTYDLFTGATHPEDVKLSDATIQASVVPGGPDHYALDFRVIWPDGSLHWLACSGYVVARDGNGQATLVRGALIDVTRLKRVEEELREAIRVRDEFLQIASHELNTPLTPLTLLLGNLHRMARRGEVSVEGLERHLEPSVRQVRRLAQLVRDLLDVTRLGRGQLLIDRQGRTSLSDLVETVLAQAALEIQRAGCTVHRAIAPGIVGEWDPARLEQILENLLGNALKYARGAHIHITLSVEDRKARLVVRDEGPGISSAALPRIFEKFDRGGLDGTQGGLGLGLYIVRQIVEGHGGTVQAASAPGEGATFIVDLPLQ
jgi:PAS domain S-box-containing protein